MGPNPMTDWMQAAWQYQVAWSRFWLFDLWSLPRNDEGGPGTVDLTNVVPLRRGDFGDPQQAGGASPPLRSASR